MEIYQWLIANNGYAVSKTGYFVYCNGITDKEEFNSFLDLRNWTNQAEERIGKEFCGEYINSAIAS